MDLLPDGTWLMMLIVVFEVPVLVLVKEPFCVSGEDDE